MIPNTKYLPHRQASKILNTKSGFTLIEALVLLFVFSVITLAFFSVMTIGTRHILISKNRLGAVALANERMEIVRNMPYDDIGTVGGVVSGDIEPEEEMDSSGKKYLVETLVRYEDDPFDGTLGGSPNDAAYKDYKTVKITVSWNNGGEDQGEVEVVSRFVSPGLEVMSPGEGILSINVFSDQEEGAGVSGASVHIVNPDTGVDEVVETDESGNVMLVGAKESIKNYQLTVSKDGYETVATFPPYPETTYNPTDVHASVIEGMLNVANIVQNKLSNIKISAKDHLGDSVEDVDFTLTGGRILGTDVPSPFEEIYNFNEQGETGSNGEKDYENVSPGQYFFEMSGSENDYELIGIDPASPFWVAADYDQVVSIRVADKNTTGILINVVKNSDSQPIEGASVRLVNGSLSYNEEIVTEGDGKAFFPTTDNLVLSAGTYELSVSADGFEDNEGQVTVSSGSLAKEDLKMIEN